MAVGGVEGAEVGFFECIVNFVFVVFCYVEYEWPEAGVVVALILFPCCCASDSDYNTCACFANFYSGCVDCCDCCFLVIGFQDDWLTFELQVRGVLFGDVELLKLLI